MITLCALSQGGRQGLVEAHGNDLAGPVAERLASAPANAVHVVALLGLIGPAVDVLLGDGFAVHCLHAIGALRNSELVGTFGAGPVCDRPHRSSALPARSSACTTCSSYTARPRSRIASTYPGSHGGATSRHSNGAPPGAALDVALTAGR